MTEFASAAGAAHAPTVVVENNVAALEAALEKARAEAAIEEPRVRLAKAEAKVAKLRAHLAGAEEALAAIRAEYGEK